ncbi:MAG: NAD(+)/NADH kinase [Dehalococcoidia bacterium]
MNEQTVPRTPPRRVGVGFHPSLDGAADLARRLAAQVEAAGIDVWLAPVGWNQTDQTPHREIADTELLVCVGGDGTVLHASGIAAGTGASLLGVRMGRLGFLSECTEAEAEDVLARALAGEGRVERRAMVRAAVAGHEAAHALNDVVVGRGGLGRTISAAVRVDGVLLAEYRADAVIISTATGSTGYALSVGGPILPPLSRDLVLVPVAPHLTKANPLVLPAEADLRLTIERGFDAVMSVDGATEQPLEAGAELRLGVSEHTVGFLRLGPTSHFYSTLADRLGWLRADHAVRSSPSAD